jgi:hypothetical protein
MFDKIKAQKSLTALQRRVMLALLRRITPADGPLGLDPEAVGALPFMEAFIMGGPPELKLGLRVALWVFEYLTFLMAFTWGRFTRQAPEVQDRTIRAYQHSRFYLKRAVLKVLLSFCLVAFYSRPEVRQRVGFDLEPLLKACAEDRRARP